MPYQSPLHILDSLQISPDDLNEEGVIRLRKKLLAEFNLNLDTTIDVNEKAYTKDAILKIIDQLKNVDDLALHKVIFGKKPLLDWLEKPEQGFFPYELAKEVLDENFKSDFYQNILQGSMAEYVKIQFKKRHFTQLQVAIDFLTNLQEKYKYDVYDVLYIQIKIIIEEIKHAQKKPNVKKNKEAFGFISEPQWTDFLNNLPENFDGIRDNYCIETNNYLVSIQDKHKQLTFEISVQLIQTLCNKELKEALDDAHEIYLTNYSKLIKLEDSTYNSGIISIIVVLFIFLRLYLVDDSPYQFPTYTPNNTYRREQVDLEIKTPAIAFYIHQIQNYQKALVKNDYPHNGQKMNIMLGEDVLSNLNAGNKAEIVDSKDKTNLQTITFKNETDYDVVIFKAGCVANRTYFIKSKDTYWIESCKGDKFYGTDFKCMLL